MDLDVDSFDGGIEVELGMDGGILEVGFEVGAEV